jgi:succinoglycan biosynthesis transport protein ExoP
MEIRQYWNLFRKWIWLVILGALLAGGVSYVVSHNTTPVYQASTTLLIAPGTAQAVDNYSSIYAAQQLAQTYAQLLQSAPIVQETYRRLGSDPEANFAQALETSGFSASAEPVRDTQLLRLSVTGTNPKLIMAAANTLVQVFIEWQNNNQQSRYAEAKSNLAAEMERVQQNIQQTEATIRDLEAQGDAADPNELSRRQGQLAQYNNSYSTLLNSYSNIGLAEASSGDTITVVSKAEDAIKIRPQVMQNTLLAAVVGAMLAAGIAFLIEYLDDTVKAPEDVAVADLNVVAVVQRASLNGQKRQRGLFAANEPKSMVSEAFRTLRTNLQFSSLDRPLHSLVVTSAVATEGKTTTSANLAVVLAQAGKKVILVDADLRRPSTHKLFDLPNREGLTTALVEEPTALNGFLRDTAIENLRVLTAGPVPPNPQELLGSQRMEGLVHKLEEQADIVVIDTPPALVVADANVLAARTDGVLLVVNTGQTRRAAVQQAVEGLRQVGANPVGAVLNMVDTRGGRGQYYYYSYYSHYYTSEKKRGWQGWAGRLPFARKRRAGQEPPEPQPEVQKERSQSA